MIYVKRKNIYDGLVVLCVVYAMFMTLFYLKASTNGEIFNWKGYGLLFFSLLILYFIIGVCNQGLGGIIKYIFGYVN